MPERKCIDCGKPFVGKASAARKYCAECRAIRKLDAQKRHHEKVIEIRKNTPPPPPNPKVLTKKDKAYCSRCIYRGSFTEEYLCNYLLRTGTAIGCKAGYGCERRVLEES